MTRVLAIGLLALSGATVWFAVAIHDPHGLDPHWSGIGTALGFAAIPVGAAEWSLFRRARGQSDRSTVAGWIGLALLALLAVAAVAVWGNLGG